MELILFFLLFTSLVYAPFSTAILGLQKNSCPTWEDYLISDLSPNCYNNPDVFSNTPAIIKRHFGAENFENHTVTTDDGYILTLFRIKRENHKGVIILTHPIIADGVLWVMQGNQSLAYFLWQMDYEIWLPNHRGTFYSERHVELSVDDYQFWNFSFHEIGIYDYPKFIEKIVEVSQVNQMAFIGHSMSGASGLVLASLMPEFSKKHITVMILMSVPAIFKYVTSPFKDLSIFVNYIEQINQNIGSGGLFRPNSPEIALIRRLVFLPVKYPIAQLLAFVAGGIPENFDPIYFNLLISLLPRGAGWKVFYHFAQLYNAGGDFRWYCHGKETNLLIYNSTLPPKYPLENVQTPIFLVASKDDSMGTLKDNELIYSLLPPKAKIYGNLTLDGVNHLDFHVGKNRYEVVYKPIFKLLDKIFK